MVNQQLNKINDVIQNDQDTKTQINEKFLNNMKFFFV